MSIGSFAKMPAARATSVSMNACGSAMVPTSSAIHSRIRFPLSSVHVMASVNT